MDAELLDAFVEEAREITQNLEVLIEDVENDGSQAEKLATFAQKIDGIMGCATTLGLSTEDQGGKAVAWVASLCEMLKKMGYLASQLKDEKKTQIVAGTMAEALELMDQLLDDLNCREFSVELKDVENTKGRIDKLRSLLGYSDEEQRAIYQKFGL